MRRIILAAMVASLVIGGAVVAYAGTTSDADTSGLTRPQTVLAEVLDELVDEGAITQRQADAITERVTERREANREAFREQAQSRREANRQARESHQKAWEDGSLTRDELESMPMADCLLSLGEEFTQAMADGKLTREELAELRPLCGFGGRQRGGMMPGGMMPGGRTFDPSET